MLFIAFQQALHIPEELGIAIKKAHDVCLVETNADLEVLRKCKENHIPDDKNSKCYLDCMVKHVRIILEDAAIHVQDIPHELTDQWHEMVTHIRGVCGKEGKSVFKFG